MRISCQLFLAKSHVFLYYIVYNRVQSTLQQSESEISNMFKKNSTSINLCLNVSTTPIMAMGCRQCLPLSVVQLKGKHYRKPHRYVRALFLTFGC